MEPADFTIEGGSAAATRLLTAQRRPTALFAASDEMAIGAILAARELGLRVPDDVSIIGVDGHELGRWFSLTTIDQFARGQGARAAEAVLAALDGAEPGRGLGTLPFEVVDRGSTAAPDPRVRRPFEGTPPHRSRVALESEQGRHGENEAEAQRDRPRDGGRGVPVRRSCQRRRRGS